MNNAAGVHIYPNDFIPIYVGDRVRFTTSSRRGIRTRDGQVIEIRSNWKSRWKNGKLLPPSSKTTVVIRPDKEWNLVSITRVNFLEKLI